MNSYYAIRCFFCFKLLNFLRSLSYVAVTSSLGFFILTIFNFIIDEQNLWSGAPFKYPGKKSLPIFRSIDTTFKICTVTCGK